MCGCRFVIGRERPGQQSEVATLIQQTLEQERRQRELLEQQYAQYDADDDEVRTHHGAVCSSEENLLTSSYCTVYIVCSISALMLFLYTGKGFHLSPDDRMF